MTITSTAGSTTRRTGAAATGPRADEPRTPSGKRREYLRDYLRWLWPHRYATAVVFLVAVPAAGIEMIEPLACS